MRLSQLPEATGLLRVCLNPGSLSLEPREPYCFSSEMTEILIPSMKQWISRDVKLSVLELFS